MPPETVCVDANIVVRYVADPKASFVVDLWEQWERQAATLVAPALLNFEVTNALYRYQRMGMMSQKSVEQALHAALALPLEISVQPDLHQQAVDLALRFDLPAAYDSHYLALSERLNAEFWTTDRKLFRVLGNRFPRARLAK